jgi:hypothetical protein
MAKKARKMDGIKKIDVGLLDSRKQSESLKNKSKIIRVSVS